MSEFLPLLLVALQVLIYSKLFNESLILSVKNQVAIDPKKKTRSDLESSIYHYRKMEKELAHNEQAEIKKVADTLVLKSQKLPNKRFSENTSTEVLKKYKREYVRVMNEEIPVYKTTQFIEEIPLTPIFSREETMPQAYRTAIPPKESKFYIEIELRINKISNNKARINLRSLQNLILPKAQY